jgi:cytochrome oxidase Cu insertion factor (SCO1/SenC/PrrC family)
VHHRKLNHSFLGAGLSLAAAVSLSLAGCSKAAAPPSEPPPASATAEQPVVSEGNADPAAVHATPPGEPAQVGKPAPDFTLKSVDGKDFTLAQFKGKTVVLEWFNPECPFVRLSHTQGSLKGLATKYTKGGDVVWLAINSGAPGKQGAGEDANKEAIAKYGIDYPVLIDNTGKVGKQYGAERTPHMYVIDPEGTLVYRGAIDNSPDAEGKSPEGGKLVNYVDTALAALKTGAKIETSETKAYGCGVKYAE